MIDEGYIIQRPGSNDRRQRLLELTPKGIAFEDRLSRGQRDRIARAYRGAGAEAVEGFRKVLTGLIEPEDRERVRTQ